MNLSRPTFARLMPLVALLVAFPAVAQDRPAVIPTRDVAVTYRAASGGDAGEMRISWLPARGLMRIDMPGGQGWMLMDTRAGTGFMVMDAQRMIMELPTGAAAPGMMPSAAARYTREGSARVANLDCVNWRIEDRGQSGRVCLTADGVMLRAEGGRTGAGPGASPGAEGRLEATAVTFGAQDPARFQRPAGYQALQMPGATGAAPAEATPGPGGQSLPRGTALPPPGLPQPGLPQPGR